MLEKTLESPLDNKEIKAVNPKGNQPWIFIGRTDAEVETPILWPPDAKSWLIREDTDAGKDWRQEEKGMTEDKMVGWHHWLNGHEFEWAPGDTEGQGSLACCSPWGHKELDTNEGLNNNNNNFRYKLNKQGDNIQPWHTPFPIWNQSTVLCPVLTVASWPAYTFFRRQVRLSGISISLGIFHSLLWSTQSKGFGVVNKAEVDVFLNMVIYYRILNILPCATVWLCCLYTVYIIVSICESHTLSPSLPPAPFLWQPQVCSLSVSLFLFCR